MGQDDILEVLVLNINDSNKRNFSEYDDILSLSFSRQVNNN